LTFHACKGKNKPGSRLKITVTICAYCEAEAELAIEGVPICEACSGKPESEIGKLATDRQVRAGLQRDILASTACAHAAAEVLSAIMRDIPSGLPHPDGSQRIQNAAHALAAARSEVMQAHSRLDEFLVRGVVPGDFEPGGSA
jgi:hypothetical protein